MASQSLVIRLKPDLSRDVWSFLGQNEAYGDLSEFVAVALRNQLSIEGVTDRSAAGSSGPEGEDFDDLLTIPRDVVVPELPSPSTGAAPPLFVLTNRLFPIKVACRVAANLSGGPPIPLASFHQKAAGAARSLGLRLRREDLEAGRKGLDRRWIGLPVSDAQDPALRRFMSSFTLHTAASGSAHGPMIQLGLAVLGDDSRDVQLTKAGWQLAVAPNPILDESQNGVFNAIERDLLIEALCAQSAERQGVLDFIEITRKAKGRQSAVDRALQETHGEWSSARVGAHRAALVGRLWDLGLASVIGRGPSAEIVLDDTVAELFGGGKK